MATKKWGWDLQMVWKERELKRRRVWAVSEFPGRNRFGGRMSLALEPPAEGISMICYAQEDGEVLEGSFGGIQVGIQ